MHPIDDETETDFDVTFDDGDIAPLEEDAARLPAGLYITATPIGNRGDITLRALEVLSKVDMIACEDTREAGKLAAIYDLPALRIPYHDHNAAEMRPKILAALERGQSVALISDAGMPLISDPGFKLVEACRAAGHHVTCLPGASATLTALVLSGLPSDRFVFDGFLPPKSAARKTQLMQLRDIAATLIYFDTAPRLVDSLADMLDVFGDRTAAVTRELTKRFEEVRRGRLSELVAHYTDAGAPKGEIVIVVGPPDAAGTVGWDDTRIDAALHDMLFEKSMSVRDAAAFVAAQSGWKKNDVYQRALTLKNAGG